MSGAGEPTHAGAGRPAPPPASVLVIGGGPAGYTFVDQLRLRGYRGELTLVDPDGLPMDRPPLSKEFLRGTMSREELLFRDQAWYDERQITVITGRVVEISGVRRGDDVAVWEVELQGERGADGREQWGPMRRAEVVVLATGAGPLTAVSDGARLERVINQFYSVREAHLLRNRMVPGARLTVVGGGLVGAEVASVAQERGAVVTLVNSSGPAAHRSFGAVAAAQLEEAHREHGVDVVQGHVLRLSELEGQPDAGGAEGAAVLVELADGRSWEADVVLQATGATPQDELALNVGADVAPGTGAGRSGGAGRSASGAPGGGGARGGGGVLVDSAGRTSVPNLLAIGDVARRSDEKGTPLSWSGHWEAAMHSAEDAAAALLGQFPEERGAKWFWSDRHGQHIEVVGDPTVGRIITREDDRGVRGVFTLGQDGDLLSAVTFDDARLARAARRLIDRGREVDAAALADPEVSARDLVRPPR